MASDISNQILTQLSTLARELQELKSAAASGPGAATATARPPASVGDVLKASESPDAIEASLKKPGNKDQYRFCSLLRGLVSQLMTALPAVETDIDEGAFTTIEEAVRAIDAQVTERIKLIRMADRSEFGWGIVPQYKADPIADDSDDEKRMKAAERSAQTVAKKAADTRMRSQSESHRFHFIWHPCISVL
jgi:hypothetical protein